MLIHLVPDKLIQRHLIPDLHLVDLRVQSTNLVVELTPESIKTLIGPHSLHHGVLDAHNQFVILAKHGGLGDETVNVSVARHRQLAV